MTLHHCSYVVHQQIALHLHDGCRSRADKHYHEVVARFFFAVVTFVVIEFGIIERHLNGGTGAGQLVQIHAHVVDILAEILFATNSPADPQQVLALVVLNTRFFFVTTDAAVF